MFKTKNLLHDAKDVPVSWVFETFCKLKEKLTGQDVKIKSLFNPKERTASMCIYVDKNNTYKFKDFSSGKGGGPIELVKELLQVNYYQACQLVVEKYNDFVLHNNGGYDLQEFKQSTKYKVTEYKIRGWNTQDQYYWTQFNIGSKLLKEYCVSPLEEYSMTKDAMSLTIKSNYLYGYFKKDGTLYKIYQPKTLNKKFLKIADYVQGSEQLENSENLIITSSLKDIMALRSLKLGYDLIAPDSENSMIRKEVMDDYLAKYNNIVVVFDNDEAGIAAMIKYKKLYPKLEMLILPLSKDPSDSIKDHGAKTVREKLLSLLSTKISKETIL